MCLFTYGKELIAEEDITCYKVMHKAFFGARSYFHEFRYWRYWKYKTNIQCISFNLDPYVNEFYIDYGFHSYQTLEEAVKNNRNIQNSFIYECVIPKGSIVYKGNACYTSVKNDCYVSYIIDDTKQYVSNQIIIKKIVK